MFSGQPNGVAGGCVADGCAGGRGIRDRSDGHVRARDFKAIQVENSSIINDGPNPKLSASRVAVEVKLRSEIIGGATRRERRVFSGRQGRILLKEQTRAARPGTVVIVRVAPGGAEVRA